MSAGRGFFNSPVRRASGGRRGGQAREHGCGRGFRPRLFPEPGGGARRSREVQDSPGVRPEPWQPGREAALLGSPDDGDGLRRLRRRDSVSRRHGVFSATGCARKAARRPPVFQAAEGARIEGSGWPLRRGGERVKMQKIICEKYGKIR